jgi:hypothetical protein
MAKFSKGQRVRVPLNTPSAASREGIVTFVWLPTTLTLTHESAGEIRSAYDQRYMVRFDGDDKPEDMNEGELEAA